LKSVDTFFLKEQHKEVIAYSHPSQKKDQQLILKNFKQVYLWVYTFSLHIGFAYKMKKHLGFVWIDRMW